jgi:hypothetical protein
MEQTIKHSQMPEFVKNPSCTTQHLHQHPTPANTVQYKSSGLAPAALIAIAICTAIISGFTSCTADRHQTAAQAEHLIKAGVKP